MATVRLSFRARLDLLAVLEHLETVATAGVARRYDDKFKAAMERLAHFPGIGSPQSRFGTKTRMLSVNPYLIFYDGGPDDADVQVLRILHGHRDITPELISSGRDP